MWSEQAVKRAFHSIYIGIGNRISKPWTLHIMAGVFLLSVVTTFLISTTQVKTESDLSIYFNYVEQQFVENKIPYRDFSLEYPPGAYILFAIPRLFTDSIEAYSIVFGIEIALFMLLGGILLYTQKRTAALFMTAMCFFFLVRIELIYQRFDLIVGVLLLLFFHYILKKKDKTAALFLGIVTSIKFFPVIFLPFLLLDSQGIKKKMLSLSFFIMGIAAIIVPFLLAGSNFDGITHFYEYHKDRGIQVESTWASAAMLLAQSFKDIHLNFDYGSWNIITSSTGKFSNMAIWVTFTGLGLLWFSMLAILRTDKNRSSNLVVYFSALLFFMMSNKVFSPQFILWLVPIFGFIVFHINQPVLQKISQVVIFCFILLCTYHIWPNNYIELLRLSPGPVITLFLRNFFFILLFFSFLPGILPWRHEEANPHKKH